MKRITIIVTLLAALLLSSCGRSSGSGGSESQKPEPPDPVEVLKQQVVAERELRQDAVATAEQEAARKELWQLLALCLAVFTLVAFFGGTAIGSKGKRHADTTDTP